MVVVVDDFDAVEENICCSVCVISLLSVCVGSGENECIFGLSVSPLHVSPRCTWEAVVVWRGKDATTCRNMSDDSSMIWAGIETSTRFGAKRGALGHDVPLSHRFS